MKKYIVLLLGIVGLTLFLQFGKNNQSLATSAGGPAVDMSLACIGGPEPDSLGGSGYLGFAHRDTTGPYAYGSEGCTRVWCPSDGNVYAYFNWGKSGPFTVGLYRNSASSPEYWNTVSGNSITLNLGKRTDNPDNLRFGFIVGVNSSSTIGIQHTSFNVQCETPPASPTPTNSPTPSGPTATPTPGPHTTAKIVLFLPAIGGRLGGNPTPGRPTRTVTLYFYTPTQDPTDPSITPITMNGTVALDSTTGSQTYGYFVSTTPIDLGGLTGTYKVLVKSNQYLRKQFIPKNGDSTATFVFTPGQNTLLPTMTLIAGDMAPAPTTTGGSYGDNTLDITDYNMLARQCYGDKANTSSCPNKEGADLNDDGKVDGIDYNILLRSFNILVNEGSQGGDGE